MSLDRSVVTVSGTGVAVGEVAIATVSAKDDAGNAVTRGGSNVVITTTGGTSVVTVGPVTDKGDGTYRAELTGVTEGTKLSVRAMLDGAPLTTAPASLRVVNPVSAGLTFAVDARNADGAKNFGGKSCPASALTLWTDLGPTASPGTLTSFPAPPCAPGSGWQGTGAPESPFRLTFNGVDDYVTYGAVNSIQQQTVLASIRKTGPGTPSATSGTGGFVNVVPVVTKGTNKAENDAVDINFYVGIASTGELASDYETSPGSTNAPLAGSTVLATNAWYMIGMTLDVGAGTRGLWVNGALDASNTVPPTLPPATGSATQFLIGGSRTRRPELPRTGALQGRRRRRAHVRPRALGRRGRNRAAIRSRPASG